MNRTELVEAVVTRTGLEKKHVEATVVGLIDTVVQETRAGEVVSLFGFGTFKPVSRAARIGRNPQTREPVRIAASKAVKFSPASAFKLALNNKGGTKKSTAKKTAAKKSSAKKSTAKTTAAKKSSANKSTAKKTAGKKAPAKKMAAKKSTAKKTTSRSAKRR